MSQEKIKLIQEVLKELGENYGTNNAISVAKRLLPVTHKIFDEGLLDYFKQSVKLEVENGFILKDIAADSANNIIGEVIEHMKVQNVHIDALAHETGLSKTVLETMFKTKHVSLNNLLQVLHLLGKDIGIIDWFERFPATKVDAPRPDIFVTSITEFAYKQLQRHSLKDLEPMSTMGANLDYFEFDVLKPGQFTITGSIDANEDMSSMFYRNLPIVIGFSPDAISTIRRLYDADPKTVIIGYNNYLATAESILEYGVIKSDDPEDDYLYTVTTIPYRLSATGDSLSDDINTFTVKLDTIYHSTISYNSITYVTKEIDEDETSNPDNSVGGDGEIEVHPTSPNEPSEGTEPAIEPIDTDREDGWNKDTNTDGDNDVPVTSDGGEGVAPIPGESNGEPSDNTDTDAGRSDENETTIGETENRTDINEPTSPTEGTGDVETEAGTDIGNSDSGTDGDNGVRLDENDNQSDKSDGGSDTTDEIGDGPINEEGESIPGGTGTEGIGSLPDSEPSTDVATDAGNENGGHSDEGVIGNNTEPSNTVSNTNESSTNENPIRNHEEESTGTTGA